MPRILLFFITICLLSQTTLPKTSWAADKAPFAATWKLMGYEQKRQFIAGYLQGWRDAASILDIAIEYVDKNPETAGTSLRKLRSVYDTTTLRPDAMVSAIDDFFLDPKNREASLSSAVTHARSTGGPVAPKKQGYDD